MERGSKMSETNLEKVIERQALTVVQQRFFIKTQKPKGLLLREHKPI